MLLRRMCMPICVGASLVSARARRHALLRRRSRRGDVTHDIRRDLAIPVLHAKMSGFSAQTRVGNWSEQAIQEAETLERLTAQREAGTLRSDVHARRLAAANTRVALPPLGDDGCLRFGQPTGVVSAGDGVLAACVHDAVLAPEQLACAAVLADQSSVSSVDSSSVIARCCVVLERCACVVVVASQPWRRHF
jgi:hypothetical protein